MSLKSKLLGFLDIEEGEIEKGLGELAETFKTQVAKAKKHVDSEISRHNKAKELMACIILAGNIQTRAIKKNPKVKILICFESITRNKIKGCVDYLNNETSWAVSMRGKDAAPLILQRIPFDSPDSLIKAVNSPID